jgi:hypothetical protein
MTEEPWVALGLQIEQAIAQAEAQGLAWTNASIFARVGGRYGDLSQYLKQRRAQAKEPHTHTQSHASCIGSLSLCDSNSRTECKRFRDHNVQTVRLRVWRWSTHLEIFSSVLRGKKPGKGLGFPGTIAHSRFSTKRSIPRFCP